MRQALVIIDIQKDYFPGGQVPLANPNAAAEAAAKVLGAARARGIPVVHVHHSMPRERGVPFLIEGTDGQQVHDLVKPLDGEVVVTKQFPNAFRETNLLEILRNLEVDTLILCGMMTHMCVDFTARAAFDLGFNVSVASDATATCPLELEGQTIEADVVRDAHLAGLAGIVAQVNTAEDVIANIENG